MLNTMWKLGALLGVIGAGFLVLLKAQTEMTAARQSPEEFVGSPEEQIEDLSDPEIQDDAGRERLGLAEVYSADAPDSAADQIVPTRAPSVTPPEQTATSNAPLGANRKDPFAAFASDAETPEPAAAPAADETDADNPFAALMANIASKARASAVADETPPNQGGINPLDAGTEATAETDEPTIDADVAANESGGIVFFPENDTDVTTVPKQFEPTSMTKVLTSPSEELSAVSDEPIEPVLVVESPEPTSPALPIAEPPAEPKPVQRGEIVQASAEQRPRADAEPNPFLIFPGAQPATPAAEARDQGQNSQQLPSVNPRGSSGQAWIADDAPATGDGDRIQHSDGTIEMTIKPRGSDPFPDFANPEPPPQRQQSEPSNQPAPARQPEPAEFNPFAAGDARPAAPPAEREAATTPRPAPTWPEAQPQPAEPTRPPRNNAIVPSGAEFPASSSNQSSNLTPADFVGVGTVAGDTPSTPQQAQLTIEKQAPPDAALGKSLIYTIIVRNVGRSPARNVIVEDLVPKGSDLEGTDPQAQITPEQKLVWKLGAMDPGADRKIRVKVIPTEAGQIGSVATVSFEAAVASRTMITAPQLRLTMNGPDEVRLGEKAPYKFTLTNTGSADATDVWIRCIVPVGFEHPAMDDKHDIEYAVGTLPRGQSKEIDLTLLASSSGQYETSGILTAEGGVSVDARQPINVIENRLKIQREGPANRFVGSQVRFTNTVSNESSRPLQNVTVTETVPPGVQFVQASDGGHFDAQRRVISWRIDGLEPGGMRRLQSVLLAENAGQLETTVRAFNQQGDDTQAVSQLTVAGFSSLTINVDNPARAIPVGGEVALKLKVRNGGTAAANTVETRVQLPPQLKFVSARGPVRYVQQGQWITFEPINRIDINGEQAFDIVLAALEASSDARVVVELTSSQLTTPLSKDESVVIFADTP